jgi:hypothetical protein
MKKKFVYILFLVFLIISATSSSSRLIIRKENYHNNIFNDDVIVDMINQLNESLYLGYLEDIVAFGERYTGTDSCFEAGTYIYNEFLSMDLEVRYHNWSYGGFQDRNIEATLYGNNNNSDEIYIICAHYDTVMGCPGADDDGSGIAALLSIAYILRQYSFNHTIRFIAFSGEEQWMYGSREYVREAYNNGDNIIAVLNVDMIGFAPLTEHAAYIILYKNEPSKWISDLVINLGQMFYDYILLEVVPLGEAPSDNLYFWNYGYDAVFFHEYEFNYYYHTSQDIIENLDISYATRSSKLILTSLVTLSNSYALNSPPINPEISGQISGRINEENNFTIITTDPENNYVSYYIDWGDGSTNDWTEFYQSGEEYIVSHIWDEQGTYTMKVKAKDSYDMESNWSLFEVSMPKNRLNNYKFHWFSNLLQKFNILYWT